LKADVAQKNTLLEQSQRQLDEVQSFSEKLQQELNTREEISKQKKEKLKETLNKLEAKHAKCNYRTEIKSWH